MPASAITDSDRRFTQQMREKEMTSSLSRHKWALLALPVLLIALAFAATPAKAEFGVEDGTFSAGTYDYGGDPADTFDVTGDPVTQAGATPFDGTVKFMLNRREVDGGSLPDGALRDVIADLPPGLVGNPLATPKCDREYLGTAPQFGHARPCPPNTQVGYADTYWRDPGGFSVPQRVYRSPVYNVEPRDGDLVNFIFMIENHAYISIVASLRDGGRAIRTVSKRNNSGVLPVNGVGVTLWGNPSDSRHDGMRGAYCQIDFLGNYGCQGGDVSVDTPPASFLRNPAHCSGEEPITDLTINSWQNPSVDKTYQAAAPPIDGCENLLFTPTVSAEPGTSRGDSPTGLQFDLEVPQESDPDIPATPPVRDVEVNLPEGITVNPSAANGLEACSPEEIGIGTDSEVRCPDASTVGSAEVKTPVLEEDLTGKVYLAEQNNNPFNEMLALYLVIGSDVRGIEVKTAGKVDADPQTGQLRAVFEDNPQLPFSNLTLDFNTGPRAPLASPDTCGTKTASISVSSWGGQSSDQDNEFRIDSNCAWSKAERSFNPEMFSGSKDPVPGRNSPYSLRITRDDGDQELDRIDVDLPKGLTADLSGIPYCSEGRIGQAERRDSEGKGQMERDDPSCPESSKVGSVRIGAGAGDNPVYVSGNAYLAGPHEGAPLSLVFIVPAMAGPLDLGVQTVRAGVHVDPETAQISATSEEIPKIMSGIPLKVRDIRIAMDRENFTLNPTNCRQMAVEGEIHGANGKSRSLASPYRVGGCAALDFEPRTFLRFDGRRFNRSANPRLRATILPNEGDANIARSVVAFPRSIMLDQSNIRTVCTRPQWANDNCPEEAIYGWAVARTPILGEPLRGPVYLRSSDNPLPDLVADLKGQVDLELVGRIDSVNRQMRTTFASVPDAPVSAFALQMQGGEKGLLVANQNLCAGSHRAIVNMAGQNGRRASDRTRINIPRCRAYRRAVRRKLARQQARRAAIERRVASTSMRR